MSKSLSKFPRQSKLAGKLRQYDITYEEIGRAIHKTGSAIEAIVNGRVDFKLSVARKIRDYISRKSKENITLSDIIE